MKLQCAVIFLAGALFAGATATAAPGPAAADDPAGATLRILAGERSPHRIPALITGKFAEHLGSNILNGMDAQILRNPTIGPIPVARVADELRIAALLVVNILFHLYALLLAPCTARSSARRGSRELLE
jgi:hypothetical protein